MGTNGKEKSIKDRGGTRSGTERRERSFLMHIPERRSGKDRRNGSDRRRSLGGQRELDYKKSPDNEDGIERRGAFREEV
jgi:hypothetical protein